MFRRLVTGAIAAASITALLSAPVAAQEGWRPGVRVFAAVYSAKDGFGGEDVGRMIQDQCRRTDTCVVNCGNQSFGDPTPQHVKECRVAYRCGGDDSVRTQVADENTALVLDCRAPPPYGYR